MSRLGECGLLFQSEGLLSLDVQGRYWALDLQCREIQGVDELVLGMHSLLLCLSPEADPENTCQQVLQLWRSITPMAPRETIVDIPVYYDGEDLIDIATRKHMSVEDIVRLHSSAEYTVFALEVNSYSNVCVKSTPSLISAIEIRCVPGNVSSVWLAVCPLNQDQVLILNIVLAPS